MEVEVSIGDNTFSSDYNGISGIKNTAIVYQINIAESGDIDDTKSKILSRILNVYNQNDINIIDLSISSIID